MPSGVFDSGFDGHIFFRRLDELGISYAVRLKSATTASSTRSKGEMKVSEAVELLPQPHTHRIKFHRREGTGWKKKELQLGFVRTVHRPEYTPGGRPSKKKQGGTRYSLVVAQGIGLKSLVILTTEDVQTKEDAGRVVNIYLERWGWRRRTASSSRASTWRTCAPSRGRG
jgi:hypothetical protein